MSIRRFGFAFAGLLVAGVASLLASGAHAGTDLSGTWSAEYRLRCSATFDQTGQSLTAAFDCGSDLAGTLIGSLDGSTFTLSGEIAGFITIDVTGSVTDDGDGLAGSFSAQPLVEAAEFVGTRLTAGDEGLDGDWEIRVNGVFGGSCTVEIEHAGSALTATVECDGRQLGVLTGALDGSTAILEGPFTQFTTLHIEAVVAPGAQSLSGTWRLDPAGPAGVIEARRLTGPTAQPTPGARTPAADEPEPTTTPAAAALPAAGDGSTGPGGLGWLMAAIALATAGAGAGVLALRGR